MAKDALAIASELRAEGLRLHALASEHLTLAMICDGTHYAVPDDARASHEEQLARMTPDQRERYDELGRRWAEREERLR